MSDDSDSYVGNKVITQEPVEYEPSSTHSNKMGNENADFENKEYENGFEFFEALSRISSIYIREYIDEELLEIESLACRERHKFEVFDSMGRLIFNITEITPSPIERICGRKRQLVFKFTNEFKETVLIVKRSCCSTFLSLLSVNCSGNCVSVRLPDGTLLGTIEQSYSCCTPIYHLKNENKEILLTLKGLRGSSCCCRCFWSREFCGTTQFNLLDNQDQHIGTMRKNCTGMNHTTDSLFSRSEYKAMFGLDFPSSFDPKIKVLLLGAALLLDYSYFEENGGLICCIFGLICCIDRTESDVIRKHVLKT